MSSSFRKLAAVRRLLPVAAGALAVAPTSNAADTYFVPSVEVAAEQYRDRSTSQGVDTTDTVASYWASLGGVLGVRSPRGLTEIQPIVELQKYPDNRDLGDGNQYLNFKSNYAASQRSTFAMVGRYSREESIDTELTKASFDTFDPNDPTVDQAGVVTLVSERKTRIQLRPSYGYEFSEKTSLKFDGLYQTVSYDSDSSFQRVGYDTFRVDGYLRWKLRPRTGFRAGVYNDRYEADNGNNETTGQGVTLGIDHQWTPLFSMEAILSGERTTAQNPRLNLEDDSTNVGLMVGVVRRGEISQFRLNAGRSYSPSGIGARTQLDQLWTQYNRDLTPLWHLQCALRAYRSRAQSFAGLTDKRDYARGELEISRELTRTWYVSGYYSYTWNEENNSIFGERNRTHTIGLQVGFQGLAPQPR